MTTTAALNYISPLPLYATEKPYLIPSPLQHVPSAQMTNIVKEVHEVVITDIRSCGVEGFTLDKHGFEYVTRPKLEINRQAETHRGKLGPEGERMVGEWLRETLGAGKVLLFDFVVS